MSPDTRLHRGAHPDDRRLFAPKWLPALRAATAELSWLLSHGYAMPSSLKLVGDRHSLTERQRLAVSRAACSDASLERRRAHCLPVQSLQGAAVIIDGFNLLITLEAALAGGVVLVCRDGCLRDLASVHGTYRAVEETKAALEVVGTALAELKAAEVEWLFDSPVSNSGRLAQHVRDFARERDWPWSAQAVVNPDAALLSSDKLAISSDSTILDGVARWVNHGAYLVERYVPRAWLVDLRA
ncbi:MAG TPA: DUF434 domain-containing protein [Chthonomonadaceae bacterium]|nr:DUF434 domain-containing protein [Chthonomonadaceae bacterium]